MNVLFCADGRHSHYGGVTSYVESLFRHLDRNRYVPFDWNLRSEQGFDNIRPRTASSSICRHVRVLRVLLTFSRLVSEGHIDLVHLNPSLGRMAVWRDTMFARECIAARVPFVIFFHGWEKDYEAYLKSNPRRLMDFVRTFSMAGKIMVLASDFKNRLVEWGIDEKSIVIETTMVDDHLMKGYDIAGRLHKNRCGRFNILFLSRIERAKGIYETIDALRILQKRHPSVTMTVAGDGAELCDATEYVMAKGVEGIEFLGWVEGATKQRVFAEADVYVFPTSHPEGMPTSVLEAMAFGLPVVTRPIGGVADFFEDGTMGFITESNDPRVLASVCDRLIQDSEWRQRIGVHNHEYARKHFLASQVTRRIESIYSSVLKDRQ